MEWFDRPNSHTLALWPNEDAVSVEEFVTQRLPQNSPWRDHYCNNNNYYCNTTKDHDESDTANASSNRRLAGRQSKSTLPTLKKDLLLLPTLRVVLLDGVYAQARNMFRAMARRLRHAPVHVALHPETLSVYHRAQNNYAQSSAVPVQHGTNHPEAFHICTVEAFALLMKELNLDVENKAREGGQGDEDDSLAISWTDKLVLAVQINNKALKHSHDVRPPPAPPSSISASSDNCT